MKKILILISVLLLSFIQNYSFAEDKFDNINQVFQLDIKTLKYEQKQLVYAIITGNKNAVKTILDSDSEPNTTYAKIPLTMFAIHSNEIEILKMLIENYNFNPDEKIMDVTPLEIAIFLKKYDAIEYLLSIGVKPTEEDLNYIKKSKNKKLKELFIRNFT